MSKTPIKRGRRAGIQPDNGLKQKPWSTRRSHVLEKVVSAALDDDRKNQAVAKKILMDRILPLSTFDRGTDFKRSINIAISTIPIRDQTVINEL